MGQSLWMALQPIVDMRSGAVVAHEALVRGAPGTWWETPAALFDWAREAGQEDLLEATCRRLAFGCVGRLPSHQQLWINVNLARIGIPLDPGRRPVEAARVGLEVSESQPILDNPELTDQLTRWREAGYAIVLDDYGAGYMGPGALLTLRPHAVKVDRHLIAGIDRDRAKQRIVHALVYVASGLDTVLVAEGVETEAEWSWLVKAGVRYGQGYLFGRPASDPVTRSVALPGRRPAISRGRRRPDSAAAAHTASESEGAPAGGQC